MITLNGKKLAANDAEFTNRLFVAGGTCVGYYRINQKSITIMDHHKVKVGVINRHGVICKAENLPNIGWYYSYGDIDIIGSYESYMQKCEDAQNALALIS